MKIILCLLILVTSQLSFATAKEEFLIVANRSHSTRLTMEEVRDLYLGKKRVVSGDWHVELLDQDNTDVRSHFYKALLSKTITEVKSYWAELVFSGRARAPSSMLDDQALLNYLVLHQDALGYVKSNVALGANIAVLLRLDDQ
jgi:hypothetical protein